MWKRASKSKPAESEQPASPPAEVYHVNDRGEGNRVSCGENCRFSGTVITLDGNGNEVVFGDNCSVDALDIYIVGDGNRIEFGRGVRVNASPLKPVVVNAVGGKTIRIGDGSLLSNNVEIHTSDYHGIYRMDDGQRVNPDRDILIGCRVWIGMSVLILKGSVIPDFCVVGAGSVVTRAFEQEHAVICGNPARVVRERIVWNEARMDQLPTDS